MTDIDITNNLINMGNCKIKKQREGQCFHAQCQCHLIVFFPSLIYYAGFFLPLDRVLVPNKDGEGCLAGRPPLTRSRRQLHWKQ